MSPKILHLYGPFYINGFGLLVAIAMCTFLALVQRTTFFKKHLRNGEISSLVTIGVLSGIFGGKFLSLMDNGISNLSLKKILCFWEPGFSVLGSISSVVIAITIYLKCNKIPVLEFFDTISVYAPLMQAIARIGCLIAGCCHGIETTLPWGIIYANELSAAPLYTKLHPTQLYSSLILFIIFLILRFPLKKLLFKRGQKTFLYLSLVSLERFSVDFLRGERAMTTWSGSSFIGTLSTSQVYSLAILLIASVAFAVVTYFPSNSQKQT